MAASKNQNSLFVAIATLVVLVIALALALSVAAVIENLRYVSAANQILELVGTVRRVASDQKGFAQNPGEDVWDDLEHAGLVIAAAQRLNPWRGDVRVVTVANSAMRIESDLPARDCRRLSFYFLGRQPAELGLLSIEAQSLSDAAAPVARIYPDSGGRKSDGLIEAACGRANGGARLALVFRVR